LHQNAGRGFRDGFGFEITFECREPGLGQEELEWKLIYVGSAADEKFDQELDSVLVGPVTIGRNQFVFQGPGPDPDRIPEKDLLGVTVLLLTCSYKQREFIRIGYFINNDLPESLKQMENAPTNIRAFVHEMRRNIENAATPRVTKFNIDWLGDGKGGEPLMVTDTDGAQPQSDVLETKMEAMEVGEDDAELDGEGEGDDEEDEDDDEGDEGDQAEEDDKENQVGMNQNRLAPHTDSHYALPPSTDSKSRDGTDLSPTFHTPGPF
jgi:histone chaperone ASF1